MLPRCATTPWCDSHTAAELGNRCSYEGAVVLHSTTAPAVYPALVSASTDLVGMARSSAIMLLHYRYSRSVIVLLHYRYSSGGTSLMQPLEASST